MKILIVQDYLRSGGTERQSLLLAAGFARASHPTTLLTFRPGGPLSPAQPEGYRLQALQIRDLGLDWLAPRLISKARTFAPDAVLCMGRMANCHGGWLQAALPRTAVICTLRTGKSLPWLFRRSLHRVTHIIANSRAARDRAVDHGWTPADRVSVIANPTVFAASSPPPPGVRQAVRSHMGVADDTIVLLNVAMFRSHKGQSTLIEVLSQLSSSTTPWELWLAGEGPTLASCQKQAISLGLGDRVRFLGWQADPRPLYAAADIAVHASRSESLSNFLIEAQTHGLPVVAAEALGVAETFAPEESGLLVPPNSPNAFREALQRLLTQPALRQSMSAHGREFSRQRFAPERQITAHLELFARLTDSPTSA